VPAPLPAPLPDLTRHAPGAAVGFMIASAGFIAGTTLMAKAVGTDALGDPLHPLQVSHGRFLFAWMTIATTLAVLRPRLTRPDFRTHLARTLCGWTGATLMFAAAAMIPLADATAISFLNPVFCMILAIPLLGERWGRWRWLAAAIALTGRDPVAALAAPAMQIGALLALGAAVVMGLELIFIKRLSGRERPLQILLINNSIGLCIATPRCSGSGRRPRRRNGPRWPRIGVLMAAAQLFSR
jgi:drug/metabolite transporter (DMT)-like permease